MEYIAFHDNKCYDGKFKECTLDYCQCFPRENGYIHKYQDRNKHVASIFGCKMRFPGNVTGDVIKAVISVKINGTGNSLLYVFIIHILFMYLSCESLHNYMEHIYEF